MGKSMTRTERAWVKYDVGNSALVLLNTSVVPIYFNSLAAHTVGAAGLVVQWGFAQTVASLLVALFLPILGSFADYAGNKIKCFFVSFVIGVAFCFGMALPLSAFAFLVVFVLSTVGLNTSMTFYDSMLTDITTDKRMDRVSTAGYAWGYIGSTVPFIACLMFILSSSSFGISTALATRLSFFITGLWWAFFTIPLLRAYKQRHYKEPCEHIIAETFSGIVKTMRHIVGDRRILIYMLAYFFYIDGVHTVIAMAASYGASLGIDSNQLIFALLTTQFVAFPSAIIYGRLAERKGTLRMLVIAVVVYMFCILYAALFLNSAVGFWVLAIVIGMFQGGIQALSRSYFGRIIPKYRSNEYYGFFDILGRYASVMGAALVSGVTALTNNAAMGVLSIGILLIIGLALLMCLQVQEEGRFL